jgi:hypothetical protein
LPWCVACGVSRFTLICAVAAAVLQRKCFKATAMRLCSAPVWASDFLSFDGEDYVFGVGATTLAAIARERDIRLHFLHHSLT